MIPRIETSTSWSHLLHMWHFVSYMAPWHYNVHGCNSHDEELIVTPCTCTKWGLELVFVRLSSVKYKILKSHDVQGFKRLLKTWQKIVIHMWTKMYISSQVCQRNQNVLWSIVYSYLIATKVHTSIRSISSNISDMCSYRRASLSVQACMRS